MMDPPTTPSSHSITQRHRQQQWAAGELSSSASVPASPAANHSNSTGQFQFPAPVHDKSSNPNNVSKLRTTSRPSTVTLPILHPQQHHSRNAAKIIKGEIHNVLTVMRSDPRYYYSSREAGTSSSSSRSSSRNRFEYEERQQQFQWSGGWSGFSGERFVHGSSSNGINNDSSGSKQQGNDWKIYSGNYNVSSIAAGTISSHPILQGLRELHDFLSVMEVEQQSINCSSSSSHRSNKKYHNHLHQPSPLTINAATFLAPFAAAVCSRDVDAKTTAAALSALHKFIAYGFIGGDCNEDEYNNDLYNSISPSSSDVVRESISIVARCIRQCSFEDTRSATAFSSTSPKKGRDGGSGGGGGRFLSFWSTSAGKPQKGSDNMIDQMQDSKSSHDLPSFLTQPRRSNHKSSFHDKGKGSSNSSTITTSSYYAKSYSSLSSSDEDMVLKLLSLSVQVIRCHAGRTLLFPVDIIGIFDTCLYVAIAAQEAERSLLRSAAADALSHCVIVVFGMRGRQPQQQHRCQNSERADYAGDGADSDDDWGERDPAEDIANEDLVIARNDIVESEVLQDLDDMPQTNAAVSKENSNIPRSSKEREAEEEEPALVAIMHRLATLADPLLHEDDTCILALSLINIALETMSDVDSLSVRYPRLLNTLQNDLCRNLLRLSTSTDLGILGLALRVIFNLFNGIKDHLKVQLEVFLTSVHLRILSFSITPNSNERAWSAPPERRELALESLLEFCREPMLMTDLYMNYDCDINCTNLFETICSTLAKVANPNHVSLDPSYAKVNSEMIPDTSTNGDGVSDMEQRPRLSILNRLALEGVLAVIDGIARKCRASSICEGTLLENYSHVHPIHNSSSSSPPDSGKSAFIGNAPFIDDEPLHEGSNPVNGSDYDFCSVSASSIASVLHDKVPLERNDSEISDDVDWLSKTRHHTSLALHERKLRKRRIAKVAAKFNERSKDKEWIEVAERVGIVPTPATPSSIASFLYSTSQLDKSRIGLYLSKGPREQYPFNSQVLECFAALFDFSGMSFSDALRTFLGRFRLPGEAQCIDRLMEAFAVRLYEVQISSQSIPDFDQSVEKAMLDPPNGRDSACDDSIGVIDPPAADEDSNVLFPFKSSDAAFIMSFSTIMLNTDLHNTNMKNEKRMTLDQFVRNNRGINGGADLPIEFLTNLYHEIKNNEIQVERDFLKDGVGGVDAFDGLLAKANDVATPFFTSNNSACHKFIHAGVHERDMYTCISTTALSAITTVFIESWDDVLVKKALDGLRNSANICSYFGLNEQFNQILDKMLGFGLDYIESVANLKYMTPVGRDLGPDLEAELVLRDIPRLPSYFIRTLSNEWNHDAHIDVGDLVGSAAHRGLLSLQCALSLSKNYLPSISDAWPTLFEVMFALRDLAALPPGLSDLDDFADSRGNPLPMSLFANRCRHQVDEYKHSLEPTVNTADNRGFLASILGRGHSSRRNGKNNSDEKEFPLSEVIQKVAQFAQLDKIIMKTNEAAMAKQILTAMLGSMFPDGDGECHEMISDPLFEHNSVFMLELAARLLIANRVHASELYPVFYAKFVTFLSPQSADSNNPSGVIIGVKFPYILERIVVTILRACIHLFDAPIIGLRDQLLRSLNLIASLPSSYTGAISDRIGCGAAIILRACFYLFDEKTDDWSTIKRLLDLAAQEPAGRGFVFDGIASVIDSIDYAIPSNDTGGDGVSDDENLNHLQLSQSGVEVMASLLLKFMNGSYNDDLSFKVPSMFYIKKVYSFSQHFDRAKADNASVNDDALLQANEFETMVTAIYNDACLSNDETTAKKGFESLQGMVVSTPLNSLPVPRWLKFLRMVADKPPSIESPVARAHHLSLTGRLLLTLVPDLSNDRENWSELEESTIAVAAIVRCNLQSGRADQLFETTVQTVTNVVNVIAMSRCNADAGDTFCAWVGETLAEELERVGACGGEISLMSAACGTNA